MLQLAINNKRIYFAMNIYLWVLSPDKLWTVDCIVAREQIVYNTDYQYIVIHQSKLPTADRSATGEMTGPAMGL